MNRHIRASLVGLTTGALAITAFAAAPAQADSQRTSSTTGISEAPHPDALPSPVTDKAAALRQQAVTAVATGKATPTLRNGSQVVKVNGKYVEVQAPAKTDQIFTVLAEFGDQALTQTGGTPGPVRNQIPEPDRVYDGGATDDNSTNWHPDSTRDYYQNLLFAKTGDSMTTFFPKESANRYGVDGQVQDWVKVPYNEARYGSNKYSQSSTYWPFVKDSANAWYNAQIAAGKTQAQIVDYLKQFDQWDRNDYDNDGNFNEPDGYIDHFQVIHAGVGEEAGGGAQGTDAIWSHRWYAYSNGVGVNGPSGDLQGGTQIGNTGIWIGDYTTEPENGGLGVFTHEYHHDLGLPDYYDTASGENGTGFWTLMSAGSWLSHDPQNIGSSPNYIGAYERLYLGWLDYVRVNYGDRAKTVKLGPVGDQFDKLPGAVLVNLPDQTITTQWTKPYSGSYEWWGGSADNLNTSLTRSIDLTGVTTAAVNFKTWFNMETDYDYLYGLVSTDGGATWTQVGAALNGASGGWVDKSFDLSAYAGQKIQFRFNYRTDGGVHYDGPFLDDISLVTDGATAWTDDVESGTGAWTADGFTRFTGTTSVQAPHFYIAENRQYVGYDANLKTGPYNFGFLNTQPNWVEKFPYQDGLLVWYVDNAYTDNNNSAHPGHGLSLPVDARPAPVTFPDGSLLNNRREPFDATFGLQPTDAVTFHKNGAAATVPSSPGIPVFDDTNPDKYWDASNPQNSVKVAGSGTRIVVADEQPNNKTMIVTVSFAKP